MAYDIFGNVLAAGHCEVHAHVREEYPCSLCIRERREYEENQARQFEREEANRKLREECEGSDYC